MSDQSYLESVQQISNEFIKEMEKQFELVCIGSGGSMPDRVREIKIVLASDQKGTIEKAREIEIIATERLVNLINSNESIRPYLFEYPFSRNKSKVSIVFMNSTAGSIVHVFCAKGNICFYTEEIKTGKRILVKEEPYEEALKIVQNKLRAERQDKN